MQSGLSVILCRLTRMLRRKPSKLMGWLHSTKCWQGLRKLVAAVAAYVLFFRNKEDTPQIRKI